MNPEHRRDWLLFAFILWFGLGTATATPGLVVCAVGAVVLLVAGNRRAARARREAAPTIHRHDEPTPEGPVLDV